MDYILKKTSASDVQEPFSLFKNRKRSYELAYNLLTRDDMEDFETEINYCKTNNDQSFYFVANDDNVEDVLRVKLDVDSITWSGPFSESTTKSERIYNLGFRLMES